MKFLSFCNENGPTWGALVDDGVVDFGARFPAFPDLKSAIEAQRLGDFDVRSVEVDYSIDDIIFLPTIPNCSKILCVGINYSSHAQETGNVVSAAPSFFTRFADTLVAHRQPIVRPSVSECLDYEGELAVVIGKGGRYISPENALDHVAGYTCLNDGSIRDFQKQSLSAGKNFPNAGSLGPVMTTADELNPTNLQLVTRLNGREMQRASTNSLIHSVAEIISYASQFTLLSPGTIIATGTPEGVGSRRVPPLWMKPGDTIEVEITGIGILSNTVVAES